MMFHTTTTSKKKDVKKEAPINSDVGFHTINNNGFEKLILLKN